MPGAPFRRIAVVGVGLIGGSIARGIRRRLPGTRLVGIDRPAVARRALARGLVHETAAIGTGIRQADLVILALPVEQILRVLPRLADGLAPGAIVTDVGSTKEAIVAAARRAGLGSRFVGGHPMAGSERSGLENADAAIFRGAPWILCPAGRGPALRRVRDLVRRLGARPILMAPRAHDAAVARLSHLPQILSVALVNSAAAGRPGTARRLAGPAFRQMSRLASSPPALWAGILRTNRRNLERAMDECAAEMRRLRSGLGDGAAACFRRAARIRARLAGRRSDT